MTAKADAVTVAYVHDGAEIAHSFAESFESLLLHDMTREQPRLLGGFVKMRCGTNGLVGARNRAVTGFLEAAKADWLLWVDSDMGFRPDALEQLIAHADPVERPIVGALCFAQKETELDDYHGYRTEVRATIFNWVQTDPDKPPWFTARAWYPPNALVKCAGTGSAFILIHRTVFERIADEYGPACWYDQIRADDGELIGEDISFCMRANALGFPVYVHTGVRTSHMKRLWLQEADFWAAHVPPPAQLDTAVVVPVMRRPHNAAPFMRSLRASTGLATAYAVYDPDDVETRDAWELAGARLIESTGPRFATKVNDGYRATSEPWLFLVGDDVRFHAGWLDHAQYASTASGGNVVATNDLANPRVMRGEHGTHLLIARGYVDEFGASWDGPKTVAHEGYRHWYVDDEMCTVAKQRGTFVAALGSKVEHLHPMVGKAPNDDVYRKGSHAADTDRKLFERRRRSNA
jgi:hypothetical protein